jgi:hypothetical protein
MHVHLSVLPLCLALIASSALAAESPAPKLHVKVLRPAEGAKWTVVPLDGGMAEDLVAHGKSLYATAGSLYRSDDGGATWSVESLPAEGQVSSLASAGDDLWLSIGENRLFRRGKDLVWKELSERFCSASAGQKQEDGTEAECNIARLVGVGKQAFVDSNRGLYRVDGERFTRLGEGAGACISALALDGTSLFRTGCMKPEIIRWQAGKTSTLKTPVPIMSSLLAARGRLAMLGSSVEGGHDLIM